MSLAGPFMFDPRAFWGEEHVRLMSDSQVCAYLKILSLQWENGDVPADPHRLACLMSEGARSYTAADIVGEARLEARREGTLEAPLQGSLWHGLQPCFKVASGRFFNERLAEEREAWVERKAALSAGGKKGGVRSAKARNKALKAKKIDQATLEAPLEARLLSPPPSQASSSLTSSPSSTTTTTTSIEEEEKKQPDEAPAAFVEIKKPKLSRFKSLEFAPALLEAVPNFVDLWKESRRIRRLGSKTTPEAEQKQITTLARWAVEFGADAVLSEIERANTGGYQGICFKDPVSNRGRSGTQPDMVMRHVPGAPDPFDDDYDDEAPYES